MLERISVIFKAANIPSPVFIYCPKIIWPDSTIFIDSSIVFEPLPKTKYDQNFEMDVGYHTDNITLYQYFLTSKDINQDIDAIHGKLFYQVCDVKQCIRHYDDFSINVIDIISMISIIIE